MGIDDTRLGEWIPRHISTLEQGQHGEMGTIMEQEKAESTTGGREK